MILFGILLAVAVVVIVRRRRKAMLAGLNAARPVFTVAPPMRRLTPRGDDRL